jgi:hypothetical protein
VPLMTATMLAVAPGDALRTSERRMQKGLV